jgi:hypothetical protein
VARAGPSSADSARTIKTGARLRLRLHMLLHQPVYTREEVEIPLFCRATVTATECQR